MLPVEMVPGGPQHEFIDEHCVFVPGLELVQCLDTCNNHRLSKVHCQWWLLTFLFSRNTKCQGVH